MEYSVSRMKKYTSLHKGILQSFKNKGLSYLAIEFETQNETFCRFCTFCIFMFTEIPLTP